MTLQLLMQHAASAVNAGDMQRAEPLLMQVVGLNPRDAEAWHMLAAIAVQGGRAEEAVGHAERAHQLDRRNHLYLNTLGVAYAERLQFDQAARCLKRAVKERPAYAEGHYNLGKVLHKTEQHEEAIKSYRRALQIQPSRTDALNGLSLILSRMGRFDEALPLLEKAGSLAPHDETIALNTGLSLLAVRGPESAQAFLEAFIAAHPRAMKLRNDLAVNLLAQGRLAQGWREFGARHELPGALSRSDVMRAIPSSIAGQHIVLLPEQGIGDHLFYLRFAYLLRERGAKLLLACSPKLLGLLEHSSELDAVFNGKAGVPENFSDAPRVLLGDLPALLHCTDTPPPFPINARTELVAHWHTRLAALGPPPYLGVTWRGGRKRPQGPEFVARGIAPLFKEIELPLIARAVRHWPGTVLVLQRLPSAEELIVFSHELGRQAFDLSPLNESLDEMAAVLNIIDEYVGVSNTNFHIRAGLGKSGRVLVPFPAEFRWMYVGNATPWYPRFAVYRQPPTRNWSEVLPRLQSDLSL